MDARKPFIVLMAMTLVAAASPAAFSPDFKAWGEGPAKYLMTRQEQKDWQSITTDEGARAFIDLFWAKRDPDLDKPGNPFRARFEALVKYANENVGEPAIPGWMTDRGKILILFGPPTRIMSTGLRSDEPSLLKPPTTGDANRDYRDLPTQTWVYEKAQRPSFAKWTVEFLFVDRFASGQFKFDRNRSKINIDSLMDQAAEHSVVHPDLKSVPAPVP